MPRSPKPALARLGLLAALLTLPALAGEGGPRVVAIGDIHGEFDGLVTILQETGLLDDRLAWAGGDAVLVQTGDMVDRGPGVRKVLDLMMRLQGEAASAGGRVVVLLGNHEILNLLGNEDYLTPEIYATFADESSEKRRRAAFKQWSRWLHRWASAHDRVANITKEFEQSWMEEHPLGYFEYREAFTPQGVYGSWLLELPVVATVAGTLFQHAGIAPDFAGTPLEEINRSVRAEIKGFVEAREALAKADIVPPVASFGKSIAFARGDGEIERSEKEQMLLDRFTATLGGVDRWLLGPPSPMWYRGYSPPANGLDQALDDETLATHLDALTHAYGTEHFVAAHSTLHEGKILSRLGGRVFLIDTGMLVSHYGGRPSALEIQGGRFTAVYPGEREVLREETAEPARDGTGPQGPSTLRPSP